MAVILQCFLQKIQNDWKFTILWRSKILWDLGATWIFFIAMFPAYLSNYK